MTAQETAAAGAVQTGARKPDYNSTRETLKLPEFGRHVQDMVDHALTIADRDERRSYAEAIIQVMAGLSPKTRTMPDYRQKLWDYLAYISDYRLDIDYPCEITRKDAATRPARLAYPGGAVRYRHYGRLIEQAIAHAEEMAEGEERDTLVRLVGNRMKRNLADWKGDGVQDAKVARDIAHYTEGKIVPDFDGENGKPLMHVSESRTRQRKTKKQ